MNSMVKGIQNLQISMDIIDGSNDFVQERCANVMDRIKEAKKKVSLVNNCLREYEDHLECQRECVKELENIRKTLLYIKRCFPRGIVSKQEDNEELPEEPRKFTDAGKSKALSNMPVKENISQTGNHLKDQQFNNKIKEHHLTSKPKNAVTLSPRSILSDKLNVMSPQTSSSSKRELNPSSCVGFSKNEIPKVNINQDISINYITTEEFSQLSSYMRGRITMTNINEFVDIFNQTLNRKYDLLKKPRKAKSAKEQEQCLIWKEQETGELAGAYFCTGDDFDKLSSIKIGNKKYLNIITILRHIKRMKEVRNMKTIYYVACF